MANTYAETSENIRTAIKPLVQEELQRVKQPGGENTPVVDGVIIPNNGVTNKEIAEAITSVGKGVDTVSVDPYKDEIGIIKGAFRIRVTLNRLDEARPFPIE